MNKETSNQKVFMLLVAVWCLVLGVTACQKPEPKKVGRTNMDSIVEHSAAYSKMRTRLKAIFLDIDSRQPSATREPIKLDPKPIYDEKNERSRNIEIVMLPQLEYPEGKPTADISFTSLLMSCLEWTGPNSPLDSGVRELPDVASDSGTSISTQLDAALKLPYLAVIRLKRYEPPQLGKDNIYRGGTLAYSVFLVDLKKPTTESVLGSFSFDVHASDDLTPSAEREKSPHDCAAYLSLWNAARKKVIEELREKTGGEFAVE